MRSKLIIALIAFCNFTYGQQIVVQNANFITDSVSMWASSADPILDDEISIFNYDWNVPFNTGSSGIVTIIGQSFGGGFQGSVSGQIGSKIRMENFTSGHLNVEYPIDVTMDMPTDYTYDQGDNVTVTTSYTALDSSMLESIYPGGEIFWDIYFRLAAQASATICVFGCTTFPIIPSFDTGLITINLVTVSSNGASTGGQPGIWYLGPGEPPPWIGGSNPDPLYPGTEPPAGSWPYAVGPSGDPTGDIFVDWIPWQVFIDAFSYSLPDNDMGFYGELALPYVETEDTLYANNTMEACGESTYLDMGVEVFKFLGFILDQIENPYTQAAALVLSNLSGEIDPLEGTSFEGLVNIKWNFFTAELGMGITNNQCFNFNPKVYASFQFPFPVSYSIIDTNNVMSAATEGSIINLELGESFNYKFPCYYEEVNFVPTYSIVGNMTNHTWDDIDFYFRMSAFAFGLEISPFTIVPGFTIPSFCFDVPYPCPSWSCPWCWCTENVCTPEIVIPPIGFSGFEVSQNGVGVSWDPPLWEDSIPIGTISYDWFNETWQLPGFNTVIGDTVKMRANQLGINHLLANVSCFGGNDGSITATATAFSPAFPYNYSWNNTAPVASNSLTNGLTNLPSGSYQLSVIDNHGCQMFDGGIITEPTPLLLTSTKTDKSCNGGTNDGAINLTVSGGTAGYTYSWNTSPVQTTQDLTNLAAGSYTVTVTDLKNCVATHTAVITEPTLLGQNGTTTNVNCFGGNNGSVQVNTYGGTLPYSYVWNNSQVSEDISALTAGIYTLTVTDAKSCTSVQAYNIAQPAAALQLSATAVDVNCYAGATGGINLTTTGGTPGYNYSWSNSAGIILPFTTEDLSNLVASVYTVQVTDAKGCGSSLSQPIIQPAAPLSSSPTTVNINCFGSATGSINPGITGGTAPYTYAWSNGATSATLTNIPAGTYTLNLTDNRSCTATYTFNLTQPSAPLAVTLSGTNILCFGQTTGAVTSNVTGGTSGYSYNWSTGSTQTSITSLPIGLYSLTITDTKGCVASASTTLTQPAAPLAASSIPTNVNCFGGITGAVDLSVNGGTMPYSYVWSNGQSLILSTTTQDLANLSANNYSVAITDNNGCQTSLSQVITQPTAPLALTGTVNHVNCFGLNDGAIDITVTGGTGAYTYNWSNGSTIQDPTALIAGNYIITVTDALGCTITDNFTVVQPNAALSVTATTEEVTCNGMSDGSVTSFVQGGTAPYSYAWGSGQITPNLDMVVAGVYTLTITDAQGCTAFTGAVVNQPVNALNVVVNITDPSCFGYDDGVVVMNITGGTQPYSFNWGNQNQILLNNPSETLSNILAGDYLFRIYDKNGCFVEQIITVGQPTPLTASYVVSDALCYGDSTGSIDLTINGATPAYSVVWSNGQTVEDPVGLPAGEYEYLITDTQGCEIRNTAIVEQPSEVKIDYTITSVSCIDQTDGEIFVSVYGGVAPYNYVWNTGQVTPSISGLAPGAYILTVSDDHLCVSNYDFYIEPSSEECVGIPNTFSPNGDDYNDTWILTNIDLYSNAQVKIFNKWGNLLYSTNGVYTPWDGTDNGNALPSEVYYYIITLGNPENNQYTGTITIVR